MAAPIQWFLGDAHYTLFKPLNHGVAAFFQCLIIAVCVIWPPCYDDLVLLLFSFEAGSHFLIDMHSLITLFTKLSQS